MSQGENEHTDSPGGGGGDGGNGGGGDHQQAGATPEASSTRVALHSKPIAACC